MLPKQRRTGLFSATQTKEVKELARAGLRNPVSVSVRVQNKPGMAGSATTDADGKAITQIATPSSLDNWFLMREYDDRPQELIDFINTHAEDKIIVFCATCACVDYYSNAFHQMTKYTSHLAKSIQVIGFHGKMVAKKRSILYKKFKSSTAGVMFSTDVAARGIDIPDVDWIVQLAAPKDPAFFVHRVGRTARAGKKGGALLFITKEEEPYIALLRGRGVPLKNGDDHEVFRQQVINEDISRSVCNTSSLPSAASAPSTSESKSGKKATAASTVSSSSSSMATSGSESRNILTSLKDLAKSDRGLLESGSTAFMSYIKAYTENLCSYIFRLETLDIGALARSYGLLRLPKMAETRGVKGKPIVFDTDPIDTSTIPYRHHEKEHARLKRLKESKEKAEQEEQERLNKKEAAKQKQWVPAEEFERVDKKRERKAKKSMRAKFQEEWDDLAAEEMLYRKFKKGKLSKDKYDDMLTSEKVDDTVLKEKRPKRGQNKKAGSDSDDLDDSTSDISDSD
jgi:ATP-dependent RNA helicase DDX55/SPB4